MKDKIKNIIIDSYNKALRERKEFYLNGAMFQVINPSRFNRRLLHWQL